MTIKFLKEWGQHLDANLKYRDEVQRALDGGGKITRYAEVVEVEADGVAHVYVLDSPGRAVSFAAALNKLRRPLHLIKADLDAAWSDRVKARDDCTCVGCGITGAKIHPAKGTKDSICAHHWLVTKQTSRMARWARPCGVAYHFAEHIHSLHENPCWLTMKPIVEHVTALEGEDAIRATIELSKVEPTEARVRALWLERCGKGQE